MKLAKRSILLILICAALSPVLALAVLSASARRPANLGVVDGRLAPCPSSPNCVSTEANDPEHRIAPMALTGPVDQAARRLETAIRTVPGLTIVEEQGGYLRAEATSRFFRFVDDVEFLIDPRESLIHFRSASRVGHSDLGANRARMERIRGEYERLPAE